MWPPLDPWLRVSVVTVLVAAGLAILALIPLRLEVSVSYRGRDPDREAEFEVLLLGGLAVFRATVPILRWGRLGHASGIVSVVGRAVGWTRAAALRETTRQRERKIVTPSRAGSAGRLAADAYHHLHRPALSLAAAIRWHRLTWETVIGLDDAMRTAVLTGALWGLKGVLAAAARSRLRLAAGLPDYRVETDFRRSGIESRLHGIGVLRAGHIILALPGLTRGVCRMLMARRVSSRRPTGRRFSWPSTPYRA